MRTFLDAAAQSVSSSPITAAQTTLTLGSTSAFGAPSVLAPTSIVILDGGNPAFSLSNPLATPYEYQLVTNNNTGTNVLTINNGTRAAYAGTTPHAFAAGAIVAAVTLAEDLIAAFPMLIASTVLAAPAASVSFTSIPSTYRHLRIRYVARDTSGNTVSTLFSVQINSDTGTNYYYEDLGARDIALPSQALAATALACGVTAGGGQGAGAAGGGLIEFPFYVSTAFAKQMVALAAQDNGGSSGVNGPWSQIITGRWTSAAAPINSLTFNCGASSFATGSSFSLEAA